MGKFRLWVASIHGNAETPGQTAKTKRGDSPVE